MIGLIKLLAVVIFVSSWSNSVVLAQSKVESPVMVKSVVGRWMERYEPPGVIVVVRREGKTEFFPFGKAHPARGVLVEPDSIFELASITKSFAATSLAIEVEEGRMKLNDPVDKYLPVLREGHDIRQVTLEELATHSSSLPRTPDAKIRRPWNRRLVMEYLVGWQAPNPPGTKSLYSNLAFGVLGYAIAEHEHQPLQEVLDRQFLHPLEMRSTFFEVPDREKHRLVQGFNPNGRPVPRAENNGGWPAGGRLCSSGRDMASFLVANMNEAPEHPRITGAMQLAQRPYFKASEKMIQGLSWQRTHQQGELVIDKNGGLDGTSTYIGMMPERKLGVVVMANRGRCQATGIGRRLLLQLAGITPEEGPHLREEDMDADHFDEGRPMPMP
jgi:beta-lactamase class C